MYRPLMVLCCVSLAASPFCSASTWFFESDPSLREEARALLETTSWLQPSGPGHGHLTDEEMYRPLEMEEDVVGDLRTKKRALSALSRWKPFSSAWSMRAMRPPGRAPLVSALMPAEVDLLSADTRTVSRPQGQPLRYGRR